MDEDALDGIDEGAVNVHDGFLDEFDVVVVIEGALGGRLGGADAGGDADGVLA